MLPSPDQTRRRPPGGAATTLALIALAAAALASSLVEAAASTSVEYELELLPGQGVAYQLEFEPAGPGVVTIDASWNGSRVVSIRVDGPPAVGTVARRSGPPPLSLEFEIDPRSAATPGAWRVSLRGLPSREHALGTLLLRLPGAPPRAAAGARPADVVRLAPREPPDDRAAWQRPVGHPVTAGAELTRLYEATERFRRLVIDDPVPDGYDWQLGFLEFVAGRRDRIGAEDELRDPAVWRGLRGVADAVVALEALRTTTDPVLLEPPPAEDSLRAAWRLVRDARFESHRRLLDELLATFRDRERVPALGGATWPVQLATCLQACRRHFETRHPEEGAVRPQADVVAAQWERVLAAGAVIRRLLEATPGVDPIGALDSAIRSEQTRSVERATGR